MADPAVARILHQQRTTPQLRRILNSGTPLALSPSYASALNAPHAFQHSADLFSVQFTPDFSGLFRGVFQGLFVLRRHSVVPTFVNHNTVLCCFGIGCRKIIGHRKFRCSFVFCQNPKRAQKLLARVSGIHAIAIAKRFKSVEYQEIEKQALAYAKNFLKKPDPFALDVKVIGNNALSSKDLENRLGASIQKQIPGLKVNLTKPKKEIFLEIRNHDFFIYSSQQPGLGGLPLGVEGSVAFFFSGKKDELVAAFLLMHRGCNVFPVVKKKSAALEKQLASLVPFNDYRKFVLTGEKDLPKLIEERIP